MAGWGILPSMSRARDHSNHRVVREEAGARLRRFLVGEWLVEPELNRISLGDTATQVEPRVMALLVSLAEQPGSVVSRDDLLEKVWNDVVVTEESLTRSVSNLRQLFGDDPRKPLYVETIRKRGYRLVAAVANPAVDEAEPAPILPRHQEPPCSPAPTALNASQRPRRYFVIGLTAGLFAAVLLATVVGFRQRGEGAPQWYEVQPLSSYLGEERGPAMSPDGTRVAFSWGGETSANFDIYIRLLSSETPLRVTSHPGHEFYPAWSPDGTRIAFIRLNRGGSELCTVSAIAGPEQLLYASETRIYSPDWSPDGSRLVFQQAVGDVRSDFRLVLFSLEERSMQTLTQPPPGISDLDPRFSPDGRRIAFVRHHRIGTVDLLSLPAEGGELTVHSTGHVRIQGLDWTPDGRSLVFSANDTGPMLLWTVAVAGGIPQRFPVAAEGLSEPSFAASGGTVAFSQRRVRLGIYRVDLANQGQPSHEKLALLGSTRGDSQPSYSPDGSRIAFVSSRSGSVELWVSDNEGENLAKLTKLHSGAVVNPVWSGDGSQIAFSTPADGWLALHLMPSSGGALRRLSPSGVNDRMSSWSRDGQWIYFASDRSGDTQLWRMRGDGSQATQVTFDGAVTAQESSDGSSLYFMRPGEVTIRSMPVGGGASVEIGTGPPDDQDTWAVGEHGIYYLRFDRGPTLTRLDPATGESIDILRVLGGVKGRLALSPDGRYLLYTLINAEDSDLLYAETAW